MDKRHLEELISVESNYWWLIAKRSLVCKILQRHFPSPAKLIEGGIGAGGNLSAFQDIGYEITGFDVLPEAVTHCQKRGLKNVYVHDLQKPWPVESKSARVVMLLDVIEHASDPIKILKNAAFTLDRKGGIIVTVPAYPSLMGPWDRMLGHYRRYTPKLLEEQARCSGLRVAWLSHWNAFSLPAAFAVRVGEQYLRYKRTAEFPPVSPRINCFLIKCADLERRLILKRSIPMGLSIIGILMHE